MPTVTEDTTQQLHSQTEESRVSLRRRAEHSDQTAYFLQTQAKPFMTAQETTVVYSDKLYLNSKRLLLINKTQQQCEVTVAQFTLCLK